MTTGGDRIEFVQEWFKMLQAWVGRDLKKCRWWGQDKNATPQYTSSSSQVGMPRLLGKFIQDKGLWQQINDSWNGCER